MKKTGFSLLFAAVSALACFTSAHADTNVYASGPPRVNLAASDAEELATAYDGAYVLQKEKEEEKEYVIGVSYHELFNEMTKPDRARAFQLIAEMLTKETGYKFKTTKYFDSYKSLRLMKAGKLDFLFIDDVTYISFVERREGALAEPVLTYTADGKKTHSTCIYVLKSAPEKTAVDLRGKEYVRGSFEQFKQLMVSNGVTEPLDGFLRDETNYDLDTVENLKLGKVDYIVATSSYIRWLRNGKNPEEAEEIRSIACEGEYTNSPVLAARGLPEDVKKKFAGAMAAAGEKMEYKELFDLFSIKDARFATAGTSDYQALRDVFKKFNTKEYREEEGRVQGAKREVEPAKYAEDMEKKLKMNPKDVAIIAWLSDYYENRGEYVKAIKCMKKIREIGADKDSAYSMLVEKFVPRKIASLYEKAGMLKEALAAAKFLLKRDPGDAFAHLTLAKVYRDTGKTGEAFLEAKMFIELNGPSLEGLGLLKWLAIDSGNFSDAEAALLELEKLSNDKAQALIETGDFYMRSIGDLGKAEEKYQAAAAMKSGSAWQANYQLAHIAIMKNPKDTATALASLKKYYKIMANEEKLADAMSLASLGFFQLLDHGDRGAYNNYLEQAMETDPGCSRCLTMGYYIESDPDAAISRCGRAMKADPKDAEAWYCLAGAYFDKRDYVKSAEYYERIRLKDPKARSQLRAILAFYKAGSKQKALELLNRGDYFTYWGVGFFDRNEEKAASTAASYLLLGEKKKWEKARAAFIKEYPASANGRHVFALAYAYTGEYGKAMLEESAAIKIDSRRYDFYYYLSTYQASLGQWEDVADSLRKAITISPNNAFNYVELGDALMKTGDKEEAEAAYRKAREIAPFHNHEYEKKSKRFP